MKKKNELTSKFWIILLIICSIFVILIALGFAKYSNTKKSVIENKEHGGEVIINYIDNITGIKLKDLVPTADSVASKNSKEGQYYDFSLDVTLDNATSINYEISVLKDEEFSTISDEDIKIYLEKENSGIYEVVAGPMSYTPLKVSTKIGTPVGSMVLYSNKASRTTTERYRLRIWLSDKSVTQKGNYGLDVYVNASA